MKRKCAAIALAWLCLSKMAFAQVAEVKSGEHADFTRIVIQAPGNTDWSFGRRIDGYELRLDSAAWKYDLSGVFDLIPRTRLASIAMDTATGGLRLGIACACHAVPFEFRPGIVVIDLKEGSPPQGSSFELALEDAHLPPEPAHRPRERPAGMTPSPVARYNWLDSMSKTEDAPAWSPDPFRDPIAQLPEPAGVASLDPLRQELLAQLSVGLSSGVINLAEPGTGPKPAVPTRNAGPWSRVTLGELQGLATNLTGATAIAMTPDGGECVEDARLALQDWGSESPVSESIAETRQGLIGEFDRPQPDALMTAAKRLIYLGFGVEARQLLQAFPPDSPDKDYALLLSLTRLVDGETDPDGPFPGQARCDTVSAFWAALATDLSLTAENIDEAGVRRGFSALPPHLRRSLGPGLVDRFIAVGNESAVVALREAMGRGLNMSDQELEVLDARIDLSSGKPEDAEARLSDVMADPGPATADAMIALVDARVAQKAAITQDTVTTLEALIEENAGEEKEPELRRALVLAHFASDNVSGAFAALPSSPATASELWSLLADRSSDQDLLAHAVRSVEELPKLPAEITSRLADRLLSLGLSQPALDWLGRPGADWNDARFLLQSRALLAEGDARAALAAVADQTSAEAEVVRARALMQLGMPDTAAAAWDAAGDPDSAAAVRTWAGDWATLAKDGPETWQSAARILSAERTSPIGVDQDGALQRGAALADDSAADRQALEGLLRSVPMPAPFP
jgi:hypothetical protein